MNTRSHSHAFLIQVEHERDMLKQQVSGLETELEFKGKTADGEHKKLEELTRERDILTKLRSQVCVCLRTCAHRSAINHMCVCLRTCAHRSAITGVCVCLRTCAHRSACLSLHCASV